MTDRTQYRIVCNDAVKEYESLPSDQWSRSAMLADDRGYNVKLQSRFICNDDDGLFWAGLTNKTGVMRIKDMVIMPWETIAEVGQQ